MNQRQRKLFLYLPSQEHHQSIQELCGEFGFSEKTIRNDIKAINAHLHMSEVTSWIQTKRGSGVQIYLMEREGEYVRYPLESEVLEIRSDLDRFYYGMILLLSRQEPYTTDILADELYTNHLQLKEDLLYWESMLRMFHLKITKGIHLHIDRDRQQLCLFMLYYFYQRVDKAMIISIESVFLQEHQSLLHDTLWLYKDAYRYHFMVNALHHFSIYLGIMTKRIQAGYGLQEQTPYVGGKRVHIMLQGYFHVDANGEEMWFPEQLIEGGIRQWNRSMLHEFVVSKETRQLTARFLVLLKQEYHGKPDEELPILFSILLQTAMIREHHVVRMFHYNDTQVKSDSTAESFDIMCLFHKDERLRELQLYENECTHLSILLLLCFHQPGVQVRFRVGMIINYSLELVHYGRIQISEALPNVDIVRILTEDEIDATTVEVSFFITFDYPHKRVPNVGIGSMVQNSNVQKLQLYLKQLRQQRSALQLISCSIYAHHAADEDALVSYLFQCYQEDYRTGMYEEFTAMLPMRRLLLHDYMLAVLYDERFSESFTSMIALRKQLYIEGEEIRQICLAGPVRTLYERL